MNFEFTPEEQAFRAEVRDFIEKEGPSRWRRHPTAVFDIFYGEGEEGLRDHRTMAPKLGARGWLSLAWPEEDGGKDSVLRQLILVEELFRHSCPGHDIFGAGMVGPTLVRWASDDQKRRFLPDIAQGRVIWCEGLSEPGHGSDLASLDTFARERGDSFILDSDPGFVVDGQKVWTSAAHCADWMFLVARTDREAEPKHRGISILLVDMKTPGITVRPLVNMAGQHEFNEVFFDGVRVPRANLLGEKNRGWRVVMTMLDIERAALPIYALARDFLLDLIVHVRQRGTPDPCMRNRLSELAVECEVARLLHYRLAWMRDRGMVPNYESAMNKLFASEVQQRVAAVGMQLFGLHGQLLAGSAWTPLDGRAPFSYLRSVGFTLEMGTSEIERNIIAQRGLGLPR